MMRILQKTTFVWFLAGVTAASCGPMAPAPGTGGFAVTGKPKASPTIQQASPGARGGVVTSLAAPTGKLAGANNGTALYADPVTARVVQCLSSGKGKVALAGLITSTGSVDSVTITGSIDGGAPVTLGEIPPQAFLHDGRIKRASYALALELDSGSHSVGLTFAQSGAQGRTSKQATAMPVSFAIACAPPDACADSGFFGDLVGNQRLGTDRGNTIIPIHARGSFGAVAALTITGPAGFSLPAQMSRSGASCVYQYQWDASNNGGAGTYTFTVSGNGKSYSFARSLN